MGEAILGREVYNYDEFVKNLRIISLNLSNNLYLSSYALRRLLNTCPIQRLNLSNFQEQLDVADILECRSGIKTLALTGCRRLRFSREGAEVSNLQRLDAEHSGIDDQVLAMTGRNCPGLVHLDLENCENVTEEGVKEVVKSCKTLRSLNPSGCSNMNYNIISWIVTFSRPSLTQLVSPSYSYPGNEQQKYFIHCGCIIYRGVDYEFLTSL